LKRRISGGDSVTGVISSWRRKMMTRPDRWGPGISEGRKKNAYRFGFLQMGRGLTSVLGRKRCPEALFYFFPLFFFFSAFLIIS
jgi:hypothetical protein